jgi:hypothetical protein
VWPTGNEQCPHLLEFKRNQYVSSFSFAREQVSLELMGQKVKRATQDQLALEVIQVLLAQLVLWDLLGSQELKVHKEIPDQLELLVW